MLTIPDDPREADRKFFVLLPVFMLDMLSFSIYRDRRIVRGWKWKRGATGVCCSWCDFFIFYVYRGFIVSCLQEREESTTCKPLIFLDILIFLPPPPRLFETGDRTHPYTGEMGLPPAPACPDCTG